MTLRTSALARRVDKLGRRRVPTGFEIVVESNREFARKQTAAVALVAFARALAGTVKVAVPASPVWQSAAEPAPSPAPLSPGTGRVWSETVRPGPHDVLTWDEVLRVPWVDETLSDRGES